MADLQDQQRLEELARKYLKGIINAAEQREFDEWFANGKAQQETESYLTETAHRDELLSRIHAEAGIIKVRKLWPRIAAAASIILFISVGGYFLLHKQRPQQFAQNQQNDIAPGHNQATLMLANGRKIILTKGLSGKLAEESNATVAANTGDAISYTSKGDNSAIEYNVMTTQKGEQSPYPLVLADGTKIWLNAASSIKFPTAFNGNSREVSITGEAYFEVAHNKNKPFRVTSNGQTVEVLGTHFNINAYGDEPAIITTLLQGSVRISKNGQQALLKPGQEAVVGDAVPVKIIKNADTEQAMAWKDGRFIFTEEPLESIMRKVSRWYNVDVVYKNKPSKLAFDGVVSRSKNISAVLEIMKSTGNVHFEVQGRRVMVITE